MDGMFKKSKLVLLSHNTLRNIKERKIILCKYGPWKKTSHITTQSRQLSENKITDVCVIIKVTKKLVLLV
jgi:hypothetical protein